MVQCFFLPHSVGCRARAFHRYQNRTWFWMTLNGVITADARYLCVAENWPSVGWANSITGQKFSICEFAFIYRDRVAQIITAKRRYMHAHIYLLKLYDQELNPGQPDLVYWVYRSSCSYSSYSGQWSCYITAERHSAWAAYYFSSVAMA